MIPAVAAAVVVVVVALAAAVSDVDDAIAADSVARPRRDHHERNDCAGVACSMFSPTAVVVLKTAHLPTVMTKIDIKRK